MNVSIICPIRNEEQYIADCIESILNQTIHPLEIIIVDGKSTDRTQKVVKEYASRYKNIHLLENPHFYVPFSLNLGIRQATGDIVIRVDGHATIADNYIEKCLEYLEKTKADCVGGPINSVQNTNTGKGIALAMSSKFGVGNSAFRTSNTPGFVDTLAFGAYRKNVFDKIGLFDEQLIRNQDDEFNYRLRKAGGKIYLNPEIKSRYFPRTNFCKLWKQYFGYGFYKVAVLKKHLPMMQLRHFVPAVFVLLLIGLGLLSFFSIYFPGILLGVLSIYVITALVIAIYLGLKTKIRLIPYIILSFPLLHFGYGIGFLWGMVNYKKFKKQTIQTI